MKSQKNIQISAPEVEKIIKDLGLLIVSMDHIGSTYHDDPKRQAIEMDEYFSNVKAFKLLARMRAVLSKAYRAQSIEADVLRLEESAESLPYWRSK